MRIKKDAITVKEFIEQLNELDQNTPIIFSAVGEIEYDINKNEILDHFKLYESVNSDSKHYDFVL